MKYGIIGVGEIAEAIVTGLCTTDDAPGILLSPRNAQRAQRLAARFPTVEVAPSNQAVIDGAETIILAVRPQQADALKELRFKGPVISLLVGADIPGAIRAVPLPSVAQRNGITPIHPDYPVARELFDQLGEALPVDDLDAFAATTATIAAYLRYIPTVGRWLSEHGVEPNQAERYVRAMFQDLEGDGSENATPGGINEQFAARLDRAITHELDQILERLRI